MLKDRPQQLWAQTQLVAPIDGPIEKSKHFMAQALEAGERKRARRTEPRRGRARLIAPVSSDAVRPLLPRLQFGRIVSSWRRGTAGGRWGGLNNFALDRQTTRETKERARRTEPVRGRALLSAPVSSDMVRSLLPRLQFGRIVSSWRRGTAGGRWGGLNNFALDRQTAG